MHFERRADGTYESKQEKFYVLEREDLTIDESAPERIEQFRLKSLKGGEILFPHHLPLGRAGAITDSNGNQIRMVYTPNGNFLQRVEADFRNSYTYVYDAEHRVERIIDSAGRAVTFSYIEQENGRINLLKTVTVAGETTTYGYDFAKRLTSVNES